MLRIVLSSDKIIFRIFCYLCVHPIIKPHNPQMLFQGHPTMLKIIYKKLVCERYSFCHDIAQAQVCKVLCWLQQGHNCQHVVPCLHVPIMYIYTAYHRLNTSLCYQVTCTFFLKNPVFIDILKSKDDTDSENRLTLRG